MKDQLTRISRSIRGKQSFQDEFRAFLRRIQNHIPERNAISGTDLLTHLRGASTIILMYWVDSTAYAVGFILTPLRGL